MKAEANDTGVTTPVIAMQPTGGISECIVCGCSGFDTLYKVRDTNQGAPGQWDLMICRECGLGVISPFPSQDQIGSFYVDQFYTEDGERFQGWAEGIRGMLAWMRGKELNRLAPGKGRLLDFGSGAGHFARVQEIRGWDVRSVDPYSSKANASGLCRLDGDRIVLEFPDQYFDVITLWYVIEHLRNPAAAIEEFRRVLKRGGILVLAQQDFASVQAKIFGPRWLILDPPRHIWQFGEKNLSRLAARYSFEKCSTSHASIELGPLTILQSMLNCLVGNENYLFRLLKNGGLRSRDKLDSRIPLSCAFASIVLGAGLTPVAFILYFALLLIGSGDVFTLYLRRK